MDWNRLAKPKKRRMLHIQGEIGTARAWVISPVFNVYFREINYALDPRKASDDSICLLGRQNFGVDMCL